jgi:alpha-glucosidase
MKAFTAGEDRLNSAYGFLYLYAPSLRAALVREGAAAWDGREGQGWPSWTFSNHDAPRAVSRWAEGRDPRTLAEMAMLLLMTLRGNAFIYQGEELALPQADVPFGRLVDPEAIANWPETLGRDGARTPIPWSADQPFAGFSTTEPWLPLDVRHPALSVDRQERDPGSMLQATRRLVALRKAHPALARGGMRLLDSSDEVLCFERLLGDERLICVFNLGHDGAPWRPPEGFTAIEQVNMDAAAPGLLPPMAGLVLAPKDARG